MWSNSELRSHLCGGVAPCAEAGHRYAEVLPQGRAGIILAVQTAALQLRHDEADEILVSAGHMGCRQHEAVASALDEPWLELVGDLLGAADDRLVHPAAAADL